MTNATGKKTIFGIPIEGEISHPREAKVQRPDEDFAKILQRVTSNKNVIEFGWRQYTPGFNDGDPSYFDTHGFWIRTVWTPEDDVDPSYDLDFPGYSSRAHGLGQRDYEWRDEEGGKGRTRRVKVYGEYEGPNEALYDAVKELAEAVDEGYFDVLLERTFGDPSEVTYRTQMPEKTEGEDYAWEDSTPDDPESYPKFCIEVYDHY